jgi:hypothetical protein
MRSDQSSLRSAIGRAAAKGAILALIAVGAQCDGLLFAQSITSAEKTALNEFDKRAADYIRTIRRSPSGKPIKPSIDAAALEKERSDLRVAVQRSRPNAKQGDIFTPQSAVVFRKLLKQTLSGPDGAKIIASLRHAEPLVPTSLAVNASFPNERGQPMQSVPASLLQNLPKLPKGLEYRVAGKALALRDLDANIVVDFIPDALP